MGPGVVFLGPSLDLATARAAVDAVFLPPAVQGSVVSAVQEFNPAAIVIIDGSFQAEPAVRHKEILWAIARGIPVLGAASMGALRAAELFPFMQGAGLIYRWFRRFAFAPDDAVAVLHGPPEIGCGALSDALVDLRLTIRAARRKKMIGAGQAAALDAAAKRLNFRERTLLRVVSDALPRAEAGEIQNLATALESTWVGQKRSDALAALMLLRDRRIRAAPTLPPLPLTAVFARDLIDSGLELNGPEALLGPP